jgi:hypothetical protein
MHQTTLTVACSCKANTVKQNRPLLTHGSPPVSLAAVFHGATNLERGMDMMEVFSAATPAQLALIGILFSFLLAWMTIFLWLALRPPVKQRLQPEEMRIPLQSPQSSRSAQMRTAVPATRQIIAQVQLHTPSIASEASHEVSLKHSQ